MDSNTLHGSATPAALWTITRHQLGVTDIIALRAPEGSAWIEFMRMTHDSQGNAVTNWEFAFRFLNESFQELPQMKRYYQRYYL